MDEATLYHTFKQVFSMAQAAMTTSDTTTNSANLLEAATRTLKIESDAINELSASINGEGRAAFVAALDVIKQASGRVIVSGMGKSGHIARKIAATFASTGTPSHFVHPGEASHGDMGMVVKGDCVIAISNGGESSELSDLLMHCKRFAIPLIGITKNPESTLGRTSDIVLALPKSPEACPFGMAPTTSTTLTLALGDALAVAMMEARGFTTQHYKVLHPGGKLGRSLILISDIMQTGDKLPLIKTGATFTEALHVITAKRNGCVGITDASGALIGIITDGDVRRIIEQCGDKSPSSLKVEEVMGKNPKSIEPGRLASEAVNLMNEKQITQVFVVEGGKPVGLVHTHDCLRAGVA